MGSEERVDRPGLLRPSVISVGIFVVSLSILSAGLADYGFTWDEAETNFPAARNQADWFKGFFSGETGFSEESIRQHFETVSDHPSLPRTAMALCRVAFPEGVQDRFALRFSTALIVSMFTALFWYVLQTSLSRVVATFATLFLFFHPRWFGHAHLAEYDIPIAMVWWVAAMGFLWANTPNDPANPSNEKILWRRSLVASFLFGLALSTKLHAFFLPFPLLVWTLVFRVWSAWRWALASAVLAPLVYLGTQPYLWWDTVNRLQNRFLDYSQKVPITTYYLGDWYPGNVPWHYPWVLLAATLPIGILLFSFAGIVAGFTQEEGKNPFGNRRVRLTFYALNAVTTPLIFSWKSPYDGIRLFMTALPFLAMTAAEGIDFLLEALRRREDRPMAPRIFSGLLVIFVALQVWSCYSTHPFQLAYYSPIMGGIPGANRIGLETTYWCDSLNDDFVDRLVEANPGKQNVALHAIDVHPFEEYRRIGRIPEDWVFNRPGLPDLHVIQFRQGFFGPVEIPSFGERLRGGC